MRAAVLQGASITVEHLADPEPAPGRILVEPLATGICGSDLHLREQMRALDASTPPEARDALPRIVPGHEFVGRVVEVGRDVDAAFRAGMRVTANPFTHAPEGPACIGLSPAASGGLATLSAVDAVRSVVVPDAVPDALAALTEPVAVGLRAVSLTDRQDGPNVVIGCGPVGLAVILALKDAGRGPILAADFSTARRAAAEALGADVVIDSAADSPWTHWADLAFTPAEASPLLPEDIGQPAAPNIFECVGAPGVIDQIMREAPQHAHVIVVGVCMHADTITPFEGVTRELTLQFSFAYRMAQFRAALALIERNAARAERLGTSTFPLPRTEAAFDSLGGRPEEIKVLVRPQEG